MTKLFRNDSPEALTRHQAVALEKKRMKERARQARELAAQGRGEDTEIAHVALGELVIPAALQSPEVLNVLRRAAASQNIPFDRLRVGSRRNSINPNTGMPEFGSELDLWGYGYDPFDPPDGIPGIDVVAPRWDGGGTAFDNPNNFGSGERPEGGASGPNAPKPHVYNGPEIEEITVTSRDSPNFRRGTRPLPLSPEPSGGLDAPGFGSFTDQDGRTYRLPGQAPAWPSSIPRVNEQFNWPRPTPTNPEGRTQGP